MVYDLLIRLNKKYDYQDVLKQIELNRNKTFKSIKMSLSLSLSAEGALSIGLLGVLKFYKDFFVYDGYNRKSLILYKDLIEYKILSDDNKTFSDTLSGAIVAGGLGAVANNIKKNTKYYFQIKFNNGYVETFKCSNLAEAEALNSIFSSKILASSNNNSIVNSGNSNNNLNLKSKLNEIKSLLEEGIITQKEYENKRQKIIDNH